MFSLTDHISKEKLETFCKKHHIKKLALFGSAIKDRLTPDSDIDVLVEFEEGFTPELITFCGVQNEFSDLIDREVDLCTPAELSRYFRNDVLAEARIEYVF